VQGPGHPDPVGVGYLEEAELLGQGQGPRVDNAPSRPPEEEGEGLFSGLIVQGPGLFGGPAGEAPQGEDFPWSKELFEGGLEDFPHGLSPLYRARLPMLARWTSLGPS